MLGQLSKNLNDMFKQVKENDKLAKAVQKELNGAKLPAAAMKNVDKILKAQAGAMNSMVKSLETAEKAAKDAVNEIAKKDGADTAALLKELEKSINQQGEIVKKLIKNASK